MMEQLARAIVAGPHRVAGHARRVAARRRAQACMGHAAMTYGATRLGG